MARQKSEFTAAIHDLLTKHKGALTHAEARPLLKGMKIQIAAQPGEKTEDLNKCIEAAANIDRPKGWKDNPGLLTEYHNKICAKAGLTGKAAKQAIADFEVFEAFKRESNYFNVTKSQWSPSSSTKPAASKNAKSKVAVVAAKRGPGRPKGSGNKTKVATKVTPKVNKASKVSEMDAVEMVMTAGGVPAVQAKIDSMKAEIESLEAALEQVVAFETRLHAA